MARVRFCSSTTPFVQGEKAVLGECLIPMSVQRCAISLFIYSDPRSETRQIGRPNLVIQ